MQLDDLCCYGGWSQKILPTVYDDSMSYYQQLCRIKGVMVECIKEIDNIQKTLVGKVSHKEMQDIYKIDKKGDFTGSWHGITHPVYSEPGIQGQVLKNMEDIKNKVDILVMDSPPPVEERDIKTFYYKITEEQTCGSDNIKVSPNMGLKEL